MPVAALAGMRRGEEQRPAWRQVPHEVVAEGVGGVGGQVLGHFPAEDPVEGAPERERVAQVRVRRALG